MRADGSRLRSARLTGVTSETRSRGNGEIKRPRIEVARMPSNIVDIHPHIVSADTMRYPVTPIGGTQSEWSKERSVTMEQLVAAMDEAEVGKAAIVHSSTTYGFNNDYVVDAVAAHPKRFTGVFSVNVTQPDAPERMRYWVSKGMSGMRIYARGSTIKEAWLSLEDPVTFPA